VPLDERYKRYAYPSERLSRLIEMLIHFGWPPRRQIGARNHGRLNLPAAVQLASLFLPTVQLADDIITVFRSTANSGAAFPMVQCRTCCSFVVLNCCTVRPGLMKRFGRTVVEVNNAV
jgi:hypothetical protein